VNEASEMNGEVDLAERLRGRSVFTFDTLQELATARPDYVIEGLLTTGSINLLVGDSNLGKTPLAITAGLAVASGKPFFGWAVPKKLTVLYCDAESQPETFTRMVATISGTLGLQRPPTNFWVYSPHWSREAPLSAAETLLDHVKALGPDVVIADPLRVLWPNAELKSDEATKVVTQLKQTGKTWLITHHRRKAHLDRSVSLEQDVHAWFQEAAGSHALVNQTDARLGVEPTGSGNAELVFGGFIRSLGPLATIYLAREYDSGGEPLGYVPLTGPELLNEHFRRAWSDLGDAFRFIDAKKALGGNSNSNTKRFLQQCQALQLVIYEEGMYRRNGSVGNDGNDVSVDRPARPTIPMIPMTSTYTWDDPQPRRGCDTTDGSWNRGSRVEH
jgi:hypothetical protein